MFWAYGPGEETNDVGTMTYEGRFVKRHFKDRETGLIKIIFYDHPPELVTYQDWAAKRKMIGHGDGVRRRDVTRTMVCC